MEAVAAQLFINNNPVTICTAYIPPDYKNKILLKHLNKLLSILPKPLIFCADINGHHPDWGSDAADKRGEIISQWIDDNELVLLNNGEPTHITPRVIHTHTLILLSVHLVWPQL